MPPCPPCPSFHRFWYQINESQFLNMNTTSNYLNNHKTKHIMLSRRFHIKYFFLRNGTCDGNETGFPSQTSWATLLLLQRTWKCCSPSLLWQRRRRQLIPVTRCEPLGQCFFFWNSISNTWPSFSFLWNVNLRGYLFLSFFFWEVQMPTWRGWGGP